MARYVMELYATRSSDDVAVVVGGGASTVDDLAQVPDGAYIIGVNTNCAGVVEPDLVVALDANTYPIPHDCQTVGQFAFNDFVTLYGNDKITSTCGFNSAFLAAAVAVQMGFGSIYLAGIDCYSGVKPYANSEMDWDDWVAMGGKPEQHSDNGSRVCAAHWARIFRDYPQVIPMSDILRHAWTLQQTG